jgi:hypothetical protein
VEALVLDIPEMEMQVLILMVVQAVVDQVLSQVLEDLVELTEIMAEQEILAAFVVAAAVAVLVV